jgi:hypothetical protein
MSKKISQKKIDANRRNAQKSTGPKTEEGKAKSAMNSIKYGIYSDKFLIKGEKKEDFDEYSNDFINWLNPNNPILLDMVSQIIASGWFVKRYMIVESAIINTKPVEEKKESKENNKSQPMVISWLDSPELEAKYEFYDERKKNEPENPQEKQKYLNNYNHEKSVAEVQEKKEKNSSIKLQEKLESIDSDVVHEDKYTEGLPNFLWNRDSLYKVNIMGKRHLANYHKALHSYFEAKKKFNNLIDMQ